jgi:hypothetical protein
VAFGRGRGSSKVGGDAEPYVMDQFLVWGKLGSVLFGIFGVMHGGGTWLRGRSCGCVPERRLVVSW